MKNRFVRNAVLSLGFFALAPVPALAQGNILTMQWGGPYTVVQVINATDSEVLVNLGGKTKWAAEGGKVNQRFGYGTWGNIAVEADVCSAISAHTFSHPIPTWATKPSIVGDAALPTDYSDPSIPDLKAKVRAIKVALKDRVAGKAMKKEIGDWERSVEHEGFGFAAKSCDKPTILVQTPDVSQWGYGQTITFLVVGNRKQGYHWERR